MGLIRSPGSPRRRWGLGTLKEEIGVWNYQGGGNDTLFFSTFLSKDYDFPGGSDGKASACNVGDPSSIPGSGRSPGEGNGNPLQHS